MAKKGGVTIPHEKAVKLINQQIMAGTAMADEKWPNEDEISIWQQETRRILEMIFGQRSSDVANFVGSTVGIVGPGDENEAEALVELRRKVRRQIAALRSSITLLEAVNSVEPEPTQTPLRSPSKIQSNEVFIVHGHDNAAKNEVARFVERLGFKATILDEQTNQGRTIIEKLADHANDAGYAIVIMSPDDRGRAAKDSPDKEKPRARQNVILELGYFLAKLGRNRVTALHFGDVEIPGDISGVVYEKMDVNGRWKFQIGRELEAAGYSVDLGKIR